MLRYCRCSLWGLVGGRRNDKFKLNGWSLFRLHVHSCTHWLRTRNPLPAFGLIYEGAISQFECEGVASKDST
jgi:hypothetical protein